jgi:hypothetical protein
VVEVLSHLLQAEPALVVVNLPDELVVEWEPVVVNLPDELVVEWALVVVNLPDELVVEWEHSAVASRSASR